MLSELFTDALDIGLYVEDRQAARVTAIALDKGYQPVFRNPRGPFVEVQYVPDSELHTHHTEGKLHAIDEHDCPAPPPLPLLYGWLERTPADRIVHILHKLPSEDVAAGITAAGAATSPEVDEANPTNANRDASKGISPVVSALSNESQKSTTAAKCTTDLTEVCGQVSFLLHLWSTPHTARAMQYHPLATGTATDNNGDSAAAPATNASHAGNTTATEGDEEDELYDAGGETVHIRDPYERERELRDDHDTLKCAVDTMLRVGKVLRENPSATVSCYVDDVNGSEYLSFE